MQGEGYSVPRRKTWDRSGVVSALRETEGRNEALADDRVSLHPPPALALAFLLRVRDGSSRPALPAGWVQAVRRWRRQVDPSYREYLKVLQEKNRMLRALRAKDEEARRAQAARERGFETNFAGANQDRIRLKEERAQGAPGSGAPRAARGPAAGGYAAAARARRVWQQGSVHIQTARGSVLRLAPPSREQTRESMQWLVSAEGRDWLETGEGQDWLAQDAGGAEAEAEAEAETETETEADEVDETVGGAAAQGGSGEGAPAGAARDHPGDLVAAAGLGNALRIIAATLAFNGLSAQEGFAEFDLDQDGLVLPAPLPSFLPPPSCAPPRSRRPADQRSADGAGGDVGQVSEADLAGVVESLGMEVSAEECAALAAALGGEGGGGAELGAWVRALAAVDPSAELRDRGIVEPPGRAAAAAAAEAAAAAPISSSAGAAAPAAPAVGAVDAFAASAETEVEAPPEAAAPGGWAGPSPVGECIRAGVLPEGPSRRMATVRESAGSVRSSRSVAARRSPEASVAGGDAGHSSIATEEVCSEDGYSDGFEDETFDLGGEASLSAGGAGGERGVDSGGGQAPARRSGEGGLGRRAAPAGSVAPRDALDWARGAAAAPEVVEEVDGLAEDDPEEEGGAGAGGGEESLEEELADEDAADEDGAAAFEASAERHEAVWAASARGAGRDKLRAVASAGAVRAAGAAGAAGAARAASAWATGRSAAGGCEEVMAAVLAPPPFPY